MATVQLKYLMLCLCILVAQIPNGVSGQCSTPPLNQAVYAGTQNITMICNSPTRNVAWRLLPADSSQYVRSITDYDEADCDSCYGVYSTNHTNLVIKTTQLSGKPLISAEAGVYVAEATSNVHFCAHLIVVQQAPSCNCTAINPTNNSVSCNLQYNDESSSPIKIKMTWTADGKFYKNETLSGKSKTNEVFSSEQRPSGPLTATSTIAISSNDKRAYTCTVAFTEPQNPPRSYCKLASNAPAFSASCTSTCQSKAKRGF